MHDGHTPLAGLPCPYCFTKLDCADAVAANRNAMPVAGAASICIECVEPSIFVDGPFGLAFRKPTKEERASIMAEIGPALMAFKVLRGMNPEGESDS